MAEIIRLICLAAIPVVLTVIFELLEGLSKFKNIPYVAKQVIVGICFGLSASLATEVGIDIGGAVVNVRDASPICAGLFFGGPAGIIAGLIGGLERWFAVLWGAGSYTRIACTVSTILAGIFAAFLRKYLFEKKKPSWYWAAIMAAVTEIFHMLMVFLTNLDDIGRAFSFVKQCAPPMIIINAVAVLVATLIISIIESSENASRDELSKRKIARVFQRWLLVCLVIAFTIITGFIWMLQTRVAEKNSRDILAQSIRDVSADVTRNSDNRLLSITKQVAKKVNENENLSNDELKKIKDIQGVSEINIIRNDGIIINSTNQEYQGFDMYSGEQASEFMRRLKGSNEYVQEVRENTYGSGTYMKYAGVFLENGYFLQVGYDVDKFTESMAEQIHGITRNRHIGQKGFVIVFDSTQQIISGPEKYEGKTLDECGLDLDYEKLNDGNVYQCNCNGEEAYVYGQFSEGYIIVSVYYKDEVILSRDMSVYVVIFMEIILFAILFTFIYILLNRRVVRDVDKINEGLMEITNGNLEVSLAVNDTAEFEQLSKGINTTVDRLKEYIAEAEARIDKELEYAKTIQSSVLPLVSPNFDHGKSFDLFVSMHTAKEVGGDFYDFYMIDKTHFAFIMADVSGKGIPAAMFMMTSKTEIKSLAMQGYSPAEIFTKANEHFCESNDAGMFVTAWMGIMDVLTGHITYVNAGHNPPVIGRAGNYEYFRTKPGLVLAAMEGISYKQGELQLNPGDILYLYTDGVTEATNAANELFEESRLLQSIQSRHGANVDELGTGIKEDVDAFVGEAPQFDDITMMVIKYKGEV